MENGVRRQHHHWIRSTAIFIANLLFQTNLYPLLHKHRIFSANAEEILAYLIGGWWNVSSAPVSLLLFLYPLWGLVIRQVEASHPWFPLASLLHPPAWLGDSKGPRLHLPTCAVQVLRRSSGLLSRCREPWSTFSQDVGQERAEALHLLC